MRIKELSQKAKDSIRNTGFLTVWEGAIRSSKTVASLLAFMAYVFQSGEKVFVMTGATQGSVYKNCIINEYGLIDLSGGAFVEKTDKNNNKYLGLQDKKIYYFGADNIGSYKKIRGATYGGWYADEINLHHINTITECFNRTVVSTDRRNFWTLNPEHPGHMIYEKYIDKYLEEEIPGYRWFHFDLEDNPAMTPARIKELEAQYTGVFYLRYILGKRVRAEGIIYASFSDDCVIKTPEAKAEMLGKIKYIEVGGDIGGNGSATVLNAVGYWLETKIGLCACALVEKYDTANLSTESILANFKNFCGMIRTRYPGKGFADAYIDSAEQLIIKSMRNLGVANVEGSAKKAIIDRIRLEDMLFAQGRLFVFDDCKELVNAFRAAVWDEKSQGEKRLDNGSTNIDSLDALEYTLEQHIHDFVY